jgi:hypothetical protein
MMFAAFGAYIVGVSAFRDMISELMIFIALNKGAFGCNGHYK